MECERLRWLGSVEAQEAACFGKCDVQRDEAGFELHFINGSEKSARLVSMRIHKRFHYIEIWLGVANHELGCLGAVDGGGTFRKGDARCFQNLLGRLVACTICGEKIRRHAEAARVLLAGVFGERYHENRMRFHFVLHLRQLGDVTQSFAHGHVFEVQTDVGIRRCLAISQDDVHSLDAGRVGVGVQITRLHAEEFERLFNGGPLELYRGENDLFHLIAQESSRGTANATFEIGGCSGRG